MTRTATILRRAAIAAFMAPLSAQPMTFTLESPAQGLVGELQRALRGASLARIARRYDLGTQELRAANPDAGRAGSLLLPTRFVLPHAPRRGIVLNLAEMRLYFYENGSEGEPQRVTTHPIGIGRRGWSTPLGTTRVIAKTEKPTWTVPASIRAAYRARGRELPAVVGPGPNNPLGDHALRLGIPNYLIHGTNQPEGIGRRVSFGCIRMYPEDVADLFQRVALQTEVRIVNQPVKAALVDDTLFVEIHRPFADDARAARWSALALAGREIGRASAGRTVTVDWERVKRLAERADGVPHAVGEVRAQRPRGDWLLVAGVFDAEAEALRLAARLRRSGLAVTVGLSFGRYQVAAGPFADARRAQRARRRIEQQTGIIALLIEPDTVTSDPPG